MAAGVLFALLATLVLTIPQHEHGGGEQLGTVHFTTSCAASAQPVFDRGVALLHSFEFGRAESAFAASVAADPSCAIAEWGIALCRWGNPFAPGVRGPAQLREGRAAIARARTVGARSERERAYIEAAARLYEAADTRDQQTRVLAYRDAMADVVKRFPADTEAAIFYALSLTASEEPTDKTYASRLQAAAILGPLFAAQPDHPGLAHYIIHSYDVPALAPRALDAARRYAQIAPSAPHALHMPSHIFTRVGAWQESIDTNIASADAARRDGVTSEELHATDYQMYAYLQTAQDNAAKRLLDGLPAIVARFDPANTAAAAPPAAGAYAAAAVPARWVLERGAWDEAARLVVRESVVPYADALTVFARALGAARTGNASGGRDAVARLQELRDKESALGETYWAGQIDIERRAASAWVSWAEGHRNDALAAMRAAADAEDLTEKAAVTPGPLAPARQLLGEMLLLGGEPAAALAAFEATLTKEPKRFRALYGAATAAARAGRGDVARAHYAELLAVCARADTPGRPELAEARDAIAGKRRGRD